MVHKGPFCQLIKNDQQIVFQKKKIHFNPQVSKLNKNKKKEILKIIKVKSYSKVILFQQN